MLIVALGGLAFAGAGRGLGEVAETTLIQVRTEDAVRSRVFAAQDGAAHVEFSAAIMVGGVRVEAAYTSRVRDSGRLSGCWRR